MQSLGVHYKMRPRDRSGLALAVVFACYCGFVELHTTEVVSALPAQRSSGCGPSSRAFLCLHHILGIATFAILVAMIGSGTGAMIARAKPD